MKRVLSIFMLCSLLVTITVGTVMAGTPDYQIIEYTGGVVPATVDGEWTTTDEWGDALTVEVTDDFVFLYNMYMDTYSCEFCVELFTDDTDDAGDYWEFCFDNGNNGGTAPQFGDYRVIIEGHTDMTVYQGNGQDWDEVTPAAGEITWDDSISDSPLESEDHWILEFTFIKTTSMITSAPPTGLRVAAYDASNSGDGVQAWAPDSDADVPDEWGLIYTYSTDSIPEGFTFTVMAVLSSISLLVGTHYLRKRSTKKEQ